MPHHCRLVADTSTLPPGGHSVQAKTVWPDGAVAVEKAGFVVAAD